MSPFDPFAVLTALFIAISGAVGFGAAITFVIQIGKLFIPKWFPDASAQNWRVGLILLFAVILFVAKLVSPETLLTFEYLDALAGSFANFGLLILPLFVALANWTSKGIYANVLRGVSVIGKSYALTAPAVKK